MLFRFFIVAISLFSFSNFVNSQDVVVKKSEIIENIDGGDCYLHFVKKGETLFAIARAYDITVNDIFKTNPESRNGIKPGVILKIPTGKSENIATEEVQNQSNDKYFYHIVKKQETLYSISRKYKVDIAEIKTINPGLSESLKEGQTIQIPVTENTSGFLSSDNDDFSKKHVVTKGETLYGIAGNYGISTGEILNANPGMTSQLKIGQELIIPNQPNPNVVKENELTKEEEKSYISHTVIKGETLYSIAQKNAVSIDTLKVHNPGLTQYLAVGMEIKVPKNKDANGYIVHNSERKSSLVEIAELYNVDYDEVARLNPRISRKAKKGQAVKIPVEELETTEAKEEITTSVQPDTLYNPCYYENLHKNRTYNIALLRPLFLEEIDSIEIKKEVTIEDIAAIPSLRFMNFYAGFMMAVDSLKQQGMNINLFVYDVDNKPEKAEKVLYSSELSSMDLIIGPFYGKSFAKFANFAKTYRIPIINPLSTREEVINDNPFVFKIRPSSKNQLDYITNYLVENYPKSNILLVRGNKYKFQTEISFIRNTLNKSRDTHIYIPNDSLAETIIEKSEQGNRKLFTENKSLELNDFSENILDSTYFRNLVKEMIYSSDSLNKLTYNLSRIRPNVVIASGDNIVFIKDILSQLNKLSLDHELTLIGLPEWNDYDGLETQQKLNLHLHCFTSFLVNYADPDVQMWIRNFRESYHSEPTMDNYAFEGFDIGWYFLNALYQAGPEFPNCLKNMNIDLIHTKFDFEKEGNNGYQNIYWDLGEYEDFQFRKIDLENRKNQFTDYIRY